MIFGTQPMTLLSTGSPFSPFTGLSLYVPDTTSWGTHVSPEDYVGGLPSHTHALHFALKSPSLRTRLLVLSKSLLLTRPDPVYRVSFRKDRPHPQGPCRTPCDPDTVRTVPHPSRRPRTGVSRRTRSTVVGPVGTGTPGTF